MKSSRDLRTINALRQMLIGACLSGLFFGWVAEEEEKMQEESKALLQEQVVAKTGKNQENKQK